MKILTLCQYYYPEPFRIQDICEELSKMGHEVTVVTGLPNYPMGQIYEGYRNGKKRDEVINGVRVHRCFTIGRRHGTIWRFLNYYSYAFSSIQYVKKLENDYDVVFVNQLSPVMMADAGIKYKKRYNKRMLLYCLDLWPESLVIGGIRQGSFLYKLFYWKSARIYRQADKILVTSKSFSTYFKDKFGIGETEYLPQYAETIFSPETCSKVPNGIVDLMFAGNIGTAQSVDIIIKAAALTKDITNLRWHIVGEGSEVESLKQLALELEVDTVIFHGRKALDDMPEYYAMADAMLVTMQKDPIISMTLPGKVQTYMAAGKPIIGAIDGETQKVIDEAKCGKCCEAENDEQFAALVRNFITDANYAEFSQNALSYYRKSYSKETFINKLLIQLDMLA